MYVCESALKLTTCKKNKYDDTNKWISHSKSAELDRSVVVAGLVNISSWPCYEEQEM